MTYGVVLRVPAPREAYEALHATINRLVDDQPVDGFILHAVRPTGDGYELLEVWETKAHSDAFNRDYVVPAMQQLGIPREPAPELVQYEPWGVQVGQLWDSHASEHHPV